MIFQPDLFVINTLPYGQYDNAFIPRSRAEILLISIFYFIIQP